MRKNGMNKTYELIYNLPKIYHFTACNHGSNLQNCQNHIKNAVNNFRDCPNQNSGSFAFKCAMYQ